MSDDQNVKKPLDRRAFVRSLAVGAAAAGVASQARAEDAAPAAPTTQPGAVWWSEYLAQDPNKTNNFYSNVIGWRMKLVALDEPARLAQPGEKGYWVMMAGRDEVAGVMRMADADFEGARNGWFTYIQVANVDQAAARATQYGGKVIREPVDSSEEDGTRIAIIQDPEGCLVGLVSMKA